MSAAPVTIHSTMKDVLEAFPGAQRTLFRRYHIGGCSSCAFQPEETLEALCARNGGLPAPEVLENLRRSHEEDAQVWIAPQELKAWLERDPEVRLVDVRSREEFEAVHIPGSVLLSQPVMREILGEGRNDRPLVLVDHRGRQSLDAAAYFTGHGLTKVRCLAGGIDAWSLEVDRSIRRYALD
jgi:rhodanese-related sulfurtransferase